MGKSHVSDVFDEQELTNSDTKEEVNRFIGGHYLYMYNNKQKRLHERIMKEFIL